MILGLLMIGLMGGAGAAATALWLDFGWLTALLAYSLGGSVTLLLCALAVALLPASRTLAAPRRTPAAGPWKADC